MNEFLHYGPRVEFYWGVSQRESSWFLYRLCKSVHTRTLEEG